MWGKSLLQKGTVNQPIYFANVVWWYFYSQGYEFLMAHQCSECPSDSEFGNFMVPDYVIIGRNIELRGRN